MAADASLPTKPTTAARLCPFRQEARPSTRLLLPRHRASCRVPLLERLSGSSEKRGVVVVVKCKGASSLPPKASCGFCQRSLRSARAATRQRRRCHRSLLDCSSSGSGGRLAFSRPTSFAPVVFVETFIRRSSKRWRGLGEQRRRPARRRRRSSRVLRILTSSKRDSGKPLLTDTGGVRGDAL